MPPLLLMATHAKLHLAPISDLNNINPYHPPVDIMKNAQVQSASGTTGLVITLWTFHICQVVVFLAVHNVRDILLMLGMMVFNCCTPPKVLVYHVYNIFCKSIYFVY